jgi:hypothetical protein
VSSILVNSRNPEIQPNDETEVLVAIENNNIDNAILNDVIEAPMEAAILNFETAVDDAVTDNGLANSTGLPLRRSSRVKKAPERYGHSMKHISENKSNLGAENDFCWRKVKKVDDSFLKLFKDCVIDGYYVPH